jgi:hypothetical protein
LRGLTDTSDTPRIKDLVHMPVFRSISRDCHINGGHIPQVLERRLSIYWKRRSQGGKRIRLRSEDMRWLGWGRPCLRLRLKLLLLLLRQTLSGVLRAIRISDQNDRLACGFLYLRSPSWVVQVWGDLVAAASSVGAASCWFGSSSSLQCSIR